MPLSPFHPWSTFQPRHDNLETQIITLSSPRPSQRFRKSPLALQPVSGADQAICALLVGVPAGEAPRAAQAARAPAVQGARAATAAPREAPNEPPGLAALPRAREKGRHHRVGDPGVAAANGRGAGGAEQDPGGKGRQARSAGRVRVVQEQVGRGGGGADAAGEPPWGEKVVRATGFTGRPHCHVTPECIQVKKRIV